MRLSRQQTGRPALIAGICAGATLLFLVLWGAPLRKPVLGVVPPFETMALLEYHTHDFMARYGRYAEPDPRLVYLAIDQRSVTLDHFPEAVFQQSPELSRMREGFPWPRDVYGMLIDRLAKAGTRVIGIDLLFPTVREGDDVFRAALDKYRDRVVIGANFVETKREAATGQAFGQFSVPDDGLIPQTMPPDDRVGYVNFWPETDEVVRRALYRTYAESVYGFPPGEDSPLLESLVARMAAKAGVGDRIPGGTGRHWIRFAGPFDPARNTGFRPISVSDVLDPVNWEATYGGGKFFEDKIVLIGPEGNWSKDFIMTPFDDMPGPEVHLNSLNAALQGEFLHPMSLPVQAWSILVAGLLAFFLALIVGRPAVRFIVFLLVTAAYLWACMWLYNTKGVMALVAAPVLTFNTAGFVSLVWEYVLERIERARTRRTLERYVSKNVVHELLDNPATYFNKLGGVRLPVALLFTDLRGFTTLTEQAEPQALVSQLNEYFSEMVAHIFRQGGTLDKFMGDAIMARWGDLQSQGPKGDVTRAVETALCMRDSLPKLNADWAERGLPQLGMGIGVNFGEAIVANMGSEEKMELTVIGDTVNLASRLEGLTKEYGVSMLIGAGAAAEIGEEFHLQLVDNVRVKGKTRPADVYTVLGRKSEPLEESLVRYLDEYEKAIAAYRATRFEEALAAFERCLEHRPDDALVKLYVERCETLISSPPGEEWDGVVVMTRK